MKTLYQIILERAMGQKELKSNNYAFLRSFLDALLDEPCSLKMGKTGGQKLEISSDIAVKFVSSVIEKMTGEKIGGKNKLKAIINDGSVFESVTDFNSRDMNKLLGVFTKRNPERLGGIKQWSDVDTEDINKGLFTVSAEEYETLISFSANKQHKFSGDYEKYNKYLKGGPKNDIKLMYLTMGVEDPDNFDPEKPKSHRELHDKAERMLAYYNNRAGRHYTEQINQVAAKLNELTGDHDAPFYKPQSDKNHLSVSDSGLNTTPKTDVCTYDGKCRYSFKKLPDSQLASGSPIENKYALQWALDECGKNISPEDKEKIEKLIKEINELGIENGKNSKQDNSKEIAEKYSELLGINDYFNEMFIYAHASGVHKFKPDEKSFADTMFEFDLDHPDECETVSTEVMAKYLAKALREKDKNGKPLLDLPVTSKGDLQNAVRIAIQSNKLKEVLGDIRDFERSIETSDDYEDDRAEEIEDEEGNEKENPSKIWHKRKNKITGKTTKNYYNSKGDSISPAEYKERIINYKKHH